MLAELNFKPNLSVQVTAKAEPLRQVVVKFKFRIPGTAYLFRCLEVR